jgi:hypothetical protein
MLLYILICLSLSLAGVAGLQFFYMIYLDRLDKDKNRRIRELETRCKKLTDHLQTAEVKIIRQNKFIDSIYEELEEEGEVWADVLEES